MTQHPNEKVLVNKPFAKVMPFITNEENNKNIINEYYRNHTLRFSESNQICVGEVFKNNERLAYCESLNIDSARQYCRQIVDEYLNKQSAENLLIKPSDNDFIKAMHAINSQIDQNFLSLLKTHTKKNNQPISIDKLKIQGDFDSTTAVFLQYAEWARLLCDALAYIPPSQPSGKDPYVSLVIQYEEPDIQATCGLSISLTPDIYKALAHISKLKI